jgi:hypothetical protein
MMMMFSYLCFLTVYFGDFFLKTFFFFLAKKQEQEARGRSLQKRERREQKCHNRSNNNNKTCGIFCVCILATVSSYILDQKYFTMTSTGEILYSISSVTCVAGVVIMFWYIMWKYVFEPNPLIRDFFDLDRKPKNRASNKKK